MKKLILLALLVVPLIYGCAKAEEKIEFGERIEKGKVKSDEISETSGIAASRRNPGVLWIHNDSGDKARIFAINSESDYLGEFELDGVFHFDWEDIAVGLGSDGEPRVYVADIGDNFKIRGVVTVYRIPEPKVDREDEDLDEKITDFETFKFRYPDGARDAETIMIDPLDKSLYLISKEKNRAGIYRAEFPYASGETVEFELVNEINGYDKFVAGDVAPDGSGILLKTIDDIYYFPRKKGESISDALLKNPQKVEYEPEKQGEAIGWSASGDGFYTLSEGEEPDLYFYPKIVTSIEKSFSDPDEFKFEAIRTRSGFVAAVNLPKTVRGNIFVFDARGKKALKIASDVKFSGFREYLIDSDKLPIGVYFAVFFSEDYFGFDEIIITR